jgi:hypothetical protein
MPQNLNRFSHTSFIDEPLFAACAAFRRSDRASSRDPSQEAGRLSGCTWLAGSGYPIFF